MIIGILSFWSNDPTGAMRMGAVRIAAVTVHKNVFLFRQGMLLILKSKIQLKMCSQQSHHEKRLHLKEWKESIHGPSSSDCNEGHLIFVGEQCRYGRFGCISFFNCASF
jgi:hypothetical protein